MACEIPHPRNKFQFFLKGQVMDNNFQSTVTTVNIHNTPPSVGVGGTAQTQQSTQGVGIPVAPQNSFDVYKTLIQHLDNKKSRRVTQTGYSLALNSGIVILFYNFVKNYLVLGIEPDSNRFLFGKILILLFGIFLSVCWCWRQFQFYKGKETSIAQINQFAPTNAALNVTTKVWKRFFSEIPEYIPPILFIFGYISLFFITK
ncbi:MAG: hypothetical protein QM537_01490 [Candidatus Symbiobacter sp.]|nr:hypothetical protein [Candidatus Symbiobacter sp.]